MQRNQEENARDVIVATDRRVNKPRTPKHRSVQAQPAPPAGVRTGSATGTTSHFERWKREGAAKSALQRIRLDRMADRDDLVPDAAAGYALLFIAGIKTVWDLSQITDDSKLWVKGVELRHLTTVEQDLKRRNVSLEWTVA